MKTYIYLITLSACMLLWTAEVYASGPLKKYKHRAPTSRGKSTVADQIEYHAGVVVGQNIATIKSRSGDSQDIILGIVAGVAGQVVWPKGFVLQPEILYSKKGCLFTGANVKYDVNYVEVPLKLMYRMQMAEVKPFGFIAPYGAYAVKLVENGETTNNDDFYSNQINKWDYGIGAGAGFDIWKIQLSFKYSWGFAQVIEENSVKNKVFTISAGFLF